MTAVGAGGHAKRIRNLLGHLLNEHDFLIWERVFEMRPGGILRKLEDNSEGAYSSIFSNLPSSQ